MLSQQQNNPYFSRMALADKASPLTVKAKLLVNKASLPANEPHDVDSLSNC